MDEYRVDLEVFAGPLDLLLYLVRKEEVDIYDIPIARITEQYVKYIEMMKELDIDLAGDFLVMAATLMEIKSAMLLPQAEAQEGEAAEISDPRAELVRQLLEYKRIKDAANLLADAADQRQQRFTRPDAILSNLKGDDEPEVDLDQVSIWTLLEAFDSIMKATGHVSSYSHISDETPIDLYQIEILHRLQTEGPTTFEKIFQDRADRLVMIGLFLAVLELIRDQLITVEQTENKGSIYLKSLTEVPAEQAVQEAIFTRHAAEQQAQLQHEKEIQTEQEEQQELHKTVMEEMEEEPELDEEDELAAELKAIDVPTTEAQPQVQTEEQSQFEQQPPVETQAEPQPKPKRPRIPIQEIPAVPDKATTPVKTPIAEANQNQ